MARWREMIMTALACLSLSVPARGQAVFAARGLSLGAYNASVRDTRGFALNPAGLVGMRDWDFTTSTYASPTRVSGGFVFHGLAFGKKLFDRSAFAFQYTPGSTVRFVIPPTIAVGGGVAAASDREISYGELFSAGLAHGFTGSFSVGLGVRVRRTDFLETEYTIQERDTITVPAVSRMETSVSSWHMDAGIQAEPWPSVILGVVGRNLLNIRGTLPPEPLDGYLLPQRRSAELAAAVAVSPSVRAMAQASTAGRGAVGLEWSPLSTLTLRGGIYLGTEETRALYAVAAGVGISYEMFELDLAYLRFTDQAERTGTANLSDFDASVMRSIELHPYAADRLALSVKAMFGNVRPSLAKIEAVYIAEGIYPAGAVALAYRPIGTARVRNVSGRPIHAKVAFFVERFMDEPTVSPPVVLHPGETTDVPLTAVFNEQIQRLTTAVVREANVTVTAAPADQVDDRFQARVLILGRNAWNGDVLSLGNFVTPDDPSVLRYSRDVLLQARDSLVGISRSLEQFHKARLLLSAFAGALGYVNDPRTSADYVQYASETLALRGGDCDDMTVMFASLLGSIGIPTAFVDVIPPGRPENSHIYLLFDTGVDPRFGTLISDNPKRFVVRRNLRGEQTIWVPVETTAIALGFGEAWTRGAQEYFDDVELGLGLVRGWVRVVDVQ